MCLLPYTKYIMQNEKTVLCGNQVYVHQRITDASDLKHYYNFGQKLGNGCFGIVVQAQEKLTEKKWAIKIILKSKANETLGGESFRSIEREIIILKMVNHPHIIHLEKVFESPKKIYLILELCREELATAFKKKKKFTEDETRYVLKQLVSAVCYLHKNLIIHRDLKLENILLAKNPEDPQDLLYIKVNDFGLGVIRQGIGIDDMLHDCCGTLTYMAPEMLAHNYNQQCDVWSMGIIMYLLLKGQFPFFSHCEKDLMKSIRKKEPSLEGINLNPEGFHLLTKMLAKDPIFRIAPSEIEQHPWILNRRMSQVYHDTNILDMMKTWKNEMMTTVGSECDWIATSQALVENSYNIATTANLTMNSIFEDNDNSDHTVNTNTSLIKKSRPVNDKESNKLPKPKSRKTQQFNNDSTRNVYGRREKDEKSIHLKSIPLNKDRKVSDTSNPSTEHRTTITKQ